METNAPEVPRPGGHKKRVAIVLGLASAVLMLALVFEDINALAVADWSNLPIGLIVRYTIAMALGGALAGYLLAGMFGRRSVLGWILALIGGVIVATFAGILGSAIGLTPDLLANGFQTTDLVAIAAGALVLPLALLGWPVLLPIWAILVIVAHVLAKRAR